MTIRNEQGFAAYVIGNESVELAVVPELGAKVISLRNLRSGREWMAAPAGGMKLFRNGWGDDFAASTLVGWDECLPTINTCDWNARALPDHGEVWSVPWEVDEASWRHGVLTTSVRLQSSPFLFQRTIALEGRTIRVGYALTNLDNAPEPFLWAMHPLFSIAPGDAFELPTEVRDQLPNETWFDTLDLADRNPAYAKIHARVQGAAHAGICNRLTGDRLTLSWNAAENNTLGMWLTRGGWHGQHHLAIEPTNAPADSLPEAIAIGRGAYVAAGDQKSWSVSIVIDQ